MTEVIANHNPLIDYAPIKFNFREITDKDSGVKTKRNSIETTLAYPSYEGLAAIVTAGGKGLDLLIEAAKAVINDAARAMLADDEALTADTFPHDALSWDAIANQPESERKGRGIAKEIWDDFFADYLSVMPSLTGKSKEIIEKHIKIMSNKFTALKANEDKVKILDGFKNFLGIYLNGSPNAESYTSAIEFLLKKADAMKESDTIDLADALGM